MAVLGSGFNFLLLVIGSAFTFLFPLYASTKTMESSSSRDDHQWLTYWVLYSFLTLIELYCSSVISWIPLWAWVKILFCMWLALPRFNGAAFLYENFAMRVESAERSKDHLKEKLNEEEDEAKKIFNAWKLVEDFIDKNGSDSLESIIKAALEAERAEMSKLKGT